jgi:hypothetical protein
MKSSKRGVQHEKEYFGFMGNSFPFHDRVGRSGPIPGNGPVLEVRDSAIVIQKGNEKWEIARDKATSISGDLKVGSEVTIYYTMQASKVEVKEAPKASAAPKKK